MPSCVVFLTLFYCPSKLCFDDLFSSKWLIAVQNEYWKYATDNKVLELNMGLESTLFHQDFRREQRLADSHVSIVSHIDESKRWLPRNCLPEQAPDGAAVYFLAMLRGRNQAADWLCSHQDPRVH